MRRILLALSLSIIFSVTAQAAPIPVYVSILPQKYFVERIGGDYVDVSVMVQPGASPATYEPKPSQMARLSNARLYFAIGVPFEAAWLQRIQTANPDMKLIRMDADITKLPMAEHTHVDHQAVETNGKHHEHDAHEHDAHNHNSHEGHQNAEGHTEHHDTAMHAEEDSHEHMASSATHHDDDHHDEAGMHHEHDDPAHQSVMEDHHGLDPHVWLSPMLAKHMAESVKRALVRAVPEQAPLFRRNFRQLEKDIDALDMELNGIFADIPAEKRVFMVFHPSWGYFAMNYNLKQIPIEYEGKEPTPKILGSLMETANATGIRTIFVQPQFSQKSAQTIARHIGGDVVTADPLSEDWAQNLRTVAAGLAESFRK